MSHRFEDRFAGRVHSVSGPLSWWIGFASSVLVAGVVSAIGFDLPMPQLVSRAPEAQVMEALSADTALVEEAPPAEPEATPEPQATPAPEEPVVAQTEQEVEAIQPLTLEDVFTVPAAPAILERVIVPKAVTPTRQPITRSPTATVAARVAPQPSRPVGGGNPSARGGRMPSPAYPSFARSGGMAGSVRLEIGISPEGSVTQVRVVGTSGFSALDEYVAQYVRRTWRLRAGPAASYLKTFTFRLG
jgi:periplasmic protein TonB